MERSRKIFSKISHVSRDVIVAANEYADRKASCRIPLAHFQLEEDMRKISLACDTLANILGKPHPSGTPDVDVRLRDWLDTEEPQICLDTLVGMIKLLRTDTVTSFTVFNPFGRFWTGKPNHDPIKEAKELLDARKDYFHFLFATDSLNNESSVQWQAAPQSEDQITLGSESSITPDQATRRQFKVSEERVQQSDDDSPSEHTAKNLKEVLEWLDGLNCAEKQDFTLSLRQPDTCKWLFDTALYKTWSSAENSCLWLRGKPGAGKSVLASSVIGSLEHDRQKGGVLAYFYCDFRNERSTNASEVFRSLLSQLLRQCCDRTSNFSGLVSELVRAKHRGGATIRNIEELACFTSRIAGLFTQRPWVIVDALDECRDVENLLTGLDALRGCVQLFVTSRPLQVIKDGLVDFPFISMEDVAEELRADIMLHVTRELDARRRLRVLENDIKAEICTVLCQEADGMFRWVQCAIDALCRCTTLKEVQEALNSLPEGLEETYERILRAIDVKSREGWLARRALVWLVAAVRPLKICELMEGLSIDLEKRSIDFSIGPMHEVALLDACGSLVTYYEKTGIIILSHFSVKEYLVGKFARAELPEYHVQWEHAHLELIRSCMCYISICLQRMSDISGFESVLAGTPPIYNGGVSSKRSDYSRPILWPLRDYVMDYAVDHFQHLGSLFGLVLDDVKVFADVIHRYSRMWDHMCFSVGRPRRPVWTRTTTYSWPCSKHDLVLFLLVAFGPISSLDIYLSHSPLKPKKHTNPLVYAAHFDREEHAIALLSQGAKLNSRGWEIESTRRAWPITVAWRYRRYSIINLFVAEGSLIPEGVFNDVFNDLRYPTGIPIPLYILTTLLQTDDFVEAVNYSDPNGRSNTNIALLMQFIQNHPSRETLVAVRRLIQVGRGSFKDGHDLAHATAEEAMCQYIGPVLHSVACLSEDDALKVTKLLIGHNCDPHIAALSEQMAIHLALALGYASIIQYAITLGIPLPPNPLHIMLGFSTQWGEPQLLAFRWLIDHGADVHMQTSAGDSLFHVVLQSYPRNSEIPLQITKLLIDYGCDPLRLNSDGNSPLQIAIEQGHISVARYLLGLGILLPRDILHSTLNSLTWELVETQKACPPVEHDANVYAYTPAEGSSSPISYTDGNSLQVIKLLIDHGCDPLQLDSDGYSPLHTAVKHAHTAIARYLLSLGVPLPSDILLFALKSWDREPWMPHMTSMVSLLIGNGADVHTHTPAGGLLPHIALRTSNGEDAVRLTKTLVDRGYDPFELDSDGNSLLHIAATCHHISVVRYLLSMGIPLPGDILLSVPTSVPDSTQMICLLIENGADVHACTSGGPFLHVVLRSFSDENALQIIQASVNRGCDPLQLDSDGYSLLHIAVRRTYNSVVQYLLSLGIPLPLDILLFGLDSWSPTHRDWEPHMTSMISLLIQNGANVHTRTPAGDSLLHVALKSYLGNNVVQITKLLVDHGCDLLRLDSLGNSLLHIAVSRYHSSVTRYLLSHGIPLPHDIFLSAMKPPMGVFDKTPMLRLLIESGANVQIRGLNGDSVFLALRFLSEENALRVARLLIERGCDPLQVDSAGRSLFHIAVELYHISVTRYLLSIGIPLPPDILLVAVNGHTGSDRMSMVRLLIENGASIHSLSPSGDSLLHVLLRQIRYPVYDDTFQIIEYLVDNGYDPSQVDSPGNSLLRIAIQHGHAISLIRYLISFGILLPHDILLVALQRMRVQVDLLHLLIENGADVQVHNPAGGSLLHLALQSYPEEVAVQSMKLLVERGCDPLQVDSSGRTPLRIALDYSLHSVAQYLQSLGTCHSEPDESDQTSTRSDSPEYCDARSAFSSLDSSE